MVELLRWKSRHIVMVTGSVSVKRVGLGGRDNLLVLGVGRSRGSCTSAQCCADEDRVPSAATSALTTGLGFGLLRTGSQAPISRVNAGRKSLLGRYLLKEHAELFPFGSGQRGA